MYTIIRLISVSNNCGFSKEFFEISIKYCVFIMLLQSRCLLYPVRGEHGKTASLINPGYLEEEILFIHRIYSSYEESIRLTVKILTEERILDIEM